MGCMYAIQAVKQSHTYYMWKCDCLSTLCYVSMGKLLEGTKKTITRTETHLKINIKYIVT